MDKQFRNEFFLSSRRKINFPTVIYTACRGSNSHLQGTNLADWRFVTAWRGGFTLFELLIVLILVSLITFMALPRFFNSMTHVELKTAARRTTALLHQARDIAYFKKKRIKVSFKMDTDKIMIFEYVDKKFNPINGLKYSYPEGIKINGYRDKDEFVSENQFDIIFSPSGNSTGGNIMLSNDKKRTYEIEVDFITGNARILER